MDGKRITSYLPDSPEELQLRLDRYTNNQKQLIKLGAANRVPVVLAIQPEITAKATQSSGQTAEILNSLGNDYQTKMKEYYPELIAVGKKLEKDLPSNVKFIDFYNFDKLPADSFIDAIHLTDEGNKAIAEQLYYSIADLAKMQIQPANIDL
ncbi:MAG: hypothetical protein HC796_10500 [Synechococcaceae cyanobacterium RL_1_2]|nr:hypothetical protein [Synechococcaceae cyanobacterium RL_1_2]